MSMARKAFQQENGAEMKRHLVAGFGMLTFNKIFDQNFDFDPNLEKNLASGL
jgi:hypothetical protein